MQTMGLHDEIDGIVYSAKAGYQKPYAGFYSFAENATGYRPDELLMVDDKLENIEAAQEQGWLAVHWSGSERLSAILRRSIGQLGL